MATAAASKVLPAVPGDVPALALLLQSVSEHDSWSRVVNGSSHNTASQLRSLCRSLSLDLCVKEKRIVKCVLAKTGEVVGVGIWGDGNVDKDSAEEQEEEGWPPGTNIAFCEDAYVVSDQIMDSVCKGQPFLKLWEIAIHPLYQRQGLGTSIMRKFVEEVDSKQVQAVLGASQKGVGLYERFGFERIKELEFDLAKYTGGKVKGWEKHLVMWRPCPRRD